MRATRVPALLLALALTAACSGDAPPEELTGDTPQTSDEADDADVDGAEGDEADAAEVVDDAAEPQAAEADRDGLVLEGGGLRLAVPEDWIVLDDDAAFDPDALAEAADALGVSPDQLEAQLQQAEALALDPVPVNDFSDNVNVALVPGPAELPDEDLLRADYAQIGADVAAVTERDTPIGDGVTVEYTLDIGTTVYGIGLFVVVDGQLVTVTVSAGQEGVAEPLFEDVVSTLQTTG